MPSNFHNKSTMSAFVSIFTGKLTEKPVIRHHPFCHRKVVFQYRWPLNSGLICKKILHWCIQIVVSDVSCLGTRESHMTGFTISVWMQMCVGSFNSKFLFQPISQTTFYLSFESPRSTPLPHLFLA